ncbi:MAG: glycogen/starch/alpha-glucan phosphorylase [Desulfovibrionaceae bacterium]
MTESISWHIVSSMGFDCERAGKANVYWGLSYAVRDYMIREWIRTQQSYYQHKVKRVYYISLEFLPGPFLMNNIINMGLEKIAEDAVKNFGFTLEEVAEVEPEPGLGNGGLGRLASCYTDSMATIKIPGYGYGIRYSYGIFRQLIENNAQIEQADNWMRFGNVWEFSRPHNLFTVRFHGHVRHWTDPEGRDRFAWEGGDEVKAMACDILVPGYQNGYVSNMRLWAAKSSKGFNLDYFNTGDYVGALQATIKSENISMVLYPNDESDEGKELRFRQQYFLVSATLQDIMRRHRKKVKSLSEIPNEAVIQLNETHPAIAIPELMRILLDEEMLDWDSAWDICVRTFAYTNHTILPEALEKWPVDMVQRLLPRHMMIIYEINRRFLEEIAQRFPGDVDRMRKLSIIEEGPVRYVRMAYLAVVGSHSVNGVAALHTEIIKKVVFRDLYEIYPERFNNKTNGITPRRFLLQTNPSLAELITESIGDCWIKNLDVLRNLEPMAEDRAFRRKWMTLRKQNKLNLAKYLKKEFGFTIPVDAMYDVQVKRIHEYKRQLLNILHVVTLYNRIKANHKAPRVPRVVMLGGKAAPGYWMAKQIIRLACNVAEVVNNDPVVGDQLKLIFLPNYSVSFNERIVPATDLSEQISTAGMEASGTGNMKFALNGALTIGTLDGANVEIMEEVGADNIFIFGLTTDQVNAQRAGLHNPRGAYEADPELRQVLDMIAGGAFSPEDPNMFKGIVSNLLDGGDWYMTLADYRSYVAAQERVSHLYLDQHEWTRRSILNTARMGKFSSDRAILEYARDIWDVTPLP